jgi:S-adenosylmethionine decarboxylase
LNFDTGTHVIVDLYGAQDIGDEATIRQAITEILRTTEATLLHQFFHRFEPHGITGMVCLAESHISVHTWPESGFAAFDIYMCGRARPERAIPILQAYFQPEHIQFRSIQRGKMAGGPPTDAPQRPLHLPVTDPAYT